MTESMTGNLQDNKPKDRCEYYKFFQNAKSGEHEYCSAKCTYNFECRCFLYKKKRSN